MESQNAVKLGSVSMKRDILTPTFLYEFIRVRNRFLKGLFDGFSAAYSQKGKDDFVYGMSVGMLVVD